MQSESQDMTVEQGATDEHRHLAIVRHCVAWQAARDSRFLDHCADDVLIDYPLATPPHPVALSGKEEIVAFSRQVSTSLPQLEVSDLSVELLSDGSSVLAQFLYETPEESRPCYRSRYCTIARFRDGLVTRYTMYFDPSALPGEPQS